MKTLLSFLVAVLVLLVHFYYSTTTIDPVLIPRFLIVASVALLLVILVVACCCKKSLDCISPFTRIVFLFVGLYLLFAAVSIIAANNLGEAFFEYIKLSLPFVLLVALILAMEIQPLLVNHLSGTVAIIALVLSTIGVLQYFDLAFSNIPGNVIPYATMANKNQLTSILLLGLPFSIYGMFRLPRLWKLLCYLAILGAVYVILISRTRSVWVALVASLLTGLVVIIVAHLKKGKAGQLFILNKKILLVVLITAIVELVAAYVTLGDVSVLFDRAKSIYDLEYKTEQKPSDRQLEEISRSIDQPEEIRTAGATLRDRSIGDRIGLWSHSLEMYADYPFLGVGPGGWRIHISGYGVKGLRSEKGIVNFQRPHNDYLWVLTENGPIAFLAYLLMFGTVLFYAFRIILNDVDSNKRILSLLMLCGVVGYMTVAFFSFPRERMAHTVMLTLFFAVIVSEYSRFFPSRFKFPRWMTYFLIAMGLVISSAALYAGYYRLTAEQHLYRAYVNRDRQNWNGVIDEIDKAGSFFMVMDPMSTPLKWYRGLAYYSMSDNEQAFIDFQDAYDINPTHIFTLNNLATLYEKNGGHQDAIKYYRKAIEISPDFYDAQLNLTAVYFNVGEYQKAFETISSIKNSGSDPRYQMYLEKVTEKLNSAP